MGPVCDTGYELLSGRHGSSHCFPARFVYLQELEGEELELKHGEDMRLAVSLSSCCQGNDGICFDAIILDYCIWKVLAYENLLLVKYTFYDDEFGTGLVGFRRCLTAIEEGWFDSRVAFKRVLALGEHQQGNLHYPRRSAPYII